ncbi:MAG: hypothetical protein KDK90_25625 [Leptospiraceae bacterium]|nr:hypothetical protein [Leptospiraceae bacterium]
MKYLCITFYLLSGFIYFIDAESFASPIHKSLYNALFCKNDSLETVRELEKQKGNLKKYGITYHSIGEDMDEVITIRF